MQVRDEDLKEKGTLQVFSSIHGCDSLTFIWLSSLIASLFVRSRGGREARLTGLSSNPFDPWKINTPCQRKKFERALERFGFCSLTHSLAALALHPPKCFPAFLVIEQGEVSR